MDNTELLTAATKLTEMNIAMQQLQAKYNILSAAVKPFEVKMLQVWQKNVEDMIDSTNIEHMSGLAHLLAQLIRARQFIDKFEFDLANKRKEIEDGSIQAE